MTRPTIAPGFLAAFLAAATALGAPGCGGNENPGDNADKAITQALRDAAGPASDPTPTDTDASGDKQAAEDDPYLTPDAYQCIQQTVGFFEDPEEAKNYLGDSDTYNEKLARSLLDDDSGDENWLLITDSGRPIAEFYIYATEDDAAQHVPADGSKQVAARFGRTVAVFPRLVSGYEEPDSPAAGDSDVFGGMNAEQRRAAATACFEGWA